MGEHHVGLVLDGDRVVAIEPAKKTERPPEPEAPQIPEDHCDS